MCVHVHVHVHVHAIVSVCVWGGVACCRSPTGADNRRAKQRMEELYRTCSLLLALQLIPRSSTGMIESVCSMRGLPLPDQVLFSTVLFRHPML